MCTIADARRIALGLPETMMDAAGSTFSVGGKAFAWPWLERVVPKRARVPNLEVLAVRVAGEADKEVLIEMDPAAFFSEPHYNGYPAILVRLPAIDEPMLAKVLEDGWRIRAPKRLIGRLGPREG